MDFLTLMVEHKCSEENTNYFGMNILNTIGICYVLTDFKENVVKSHRDIHDVYHYIYLEPNCLQLSELLFFGTQSWKLLQTLSTEQQLFIMHQF